MKRLRLTASAALCVCLTALAADVRAAFTYFDADIIGYTLAGSKTSPETPVAPNTTLVDGSPAPYVVGVGSGGTGVDGLWRVRESDGFGNKATSALVVPGGDKPSADSGGGEQLLGDIIEARGDFGADNTEDVPTLKTTVAVPGPDQGQEKAVYAFFWTAGTAAWQIGASLTNSNDGELSASNHLQPVFAAGNPGLVAYEMIRQEANSTHLFNVFDASTESGTPPADAIALNPLYAADDSLLTTTDGANSGGAAGDRQLWAAFLGNVTLGDELSVFIGESISSTDFLSGGNNRTWYDGIGYGDPVQGLSPLPDVQPIIPEPTSVALLSLGIAGFASRRRR